MYETSVISPSLTQHDVPGSAAAGILSDSVFVVFGEDDGRRGREEVDQEENGTLHDDDDGHTLVAAVDRFGVLMAGSSCCLLAIQSNHVASFAQRPLERRRCSSTAAAIKGWTGGRAGAVAVGAATDFPPYYLGSSKVKSVVQLPCV